MSEPKPVCAYCGSDQHPRKLITLRSGKQVVICKDTVACLNRSHDDSNTGTEQE